MFGVIPQTIWHKRYAAVNDMCRLSMNCLYIETAGRKMIIDAGVGLKYPERCASYGFEEVKDIADQLAGYGISTSDITDVVFTHLHFDHCGGATFFDQSGELRLTFPGARHWVSRVQWDYALSPALFDRDAYWPENYELIASSGLLHFAEDGMALCEGVHFELYDGHTSGQIVPVIELNNTRLCFTGDVIPTSAHISLLWLSAYDACSVNSVDAKLKLLNKSVAEKRILLTSHDVKTKFFSVKKVGEFFKKVPADFSGM